MIRKSWVVLFLLFSFLIFSEKAIAADETPCMPPKIIRLIPNSGKAGDTIHIKGRRFGLNTWKVTFNGVPAEVLTWRMETIYLKAPDKAKSGPVIVNNGCDKSNEIPFTYEGLPQEK